MTIAWCRPVTPTTWLDAFPMRRCGSIPTQATAASSLGRTENPQWYRNLLAHPDVHIQIGPQRRAVRAAVASPQERARLWPRLVEAYADYDSYQRGTGREIPVIILQPR